MKVAVVISGQPRNFWLGHPSHHAWILSNFPDADVYMHCWDDPNMAGERYINEGGHVVTKPFPKDYRDNLVDLYKPKSILFEQPKPVEFYNLQERHFGKMFPNVTLSATYSMYYSMYRSFCLLEDSGVEYDLVYRLRYDWDIHHIPAVEFEANTVYAPNDCPHRQSLSDQFAFGDMNAMRGYCKTYEDLEGLCDRVYGIVAEPIQFLRLTELGINMHPLAIRYRIIKES